MRWTWSVFRDSFARSSSSSSACQIRHALTDVIGSKHGIGVENLNGSAAIAGETARAYRETMTLSFVSGRTSFCVSRYAVDAGCRFLCVCVLMRSLTNLPTQIVFFRCIHDP
jgi:hypothetical protein